MKEGTKGGRKRKEGRTEGGYQEWSKGKEGAKGRGVKFIKEQRKERRTQKDGRNKGSTKDEGTTEGRTEGLEEERGGGRDLGSGMC